MVAGKSQRNDSSVSPSQLANRSNNDRREISKGHSPKIPVVETLPVDTPQGSMRYSTNRKMFLRAKEPGGKALLHRGELRLCSGVPRRAFHCIGFLLIVN